MGDIGKKRQVYRTELQHSPTYAIQKTANTTDVQSLVDTMITVPGDIGNNME